jgi:hypothetical protein
LRWKNALLPNNDWPVEWLKAEYDRARSSLCMVNLGNGSRISFGGGLTIPISPGDPRSYDFLERFAADAPFKMSAKHFMVNLPIGSNGKLRWRKPDAQILARLEQAIRLPERR